MKLLNKGWVLLSVLIIGLSMASLAGATMITDLCRLTIVDASDVNKYGWDPGDTVSFTITYDNTYIPETGHYRISYYPMFEDGVDEYQYFTMAGIPDFYLWDADYIPPSIDFQDGKLVSMHAYGEVGATIFFGIGGETFYNTGFYAEHDIDLPGMWDITGHVDYAVPEASTALLLSGCFLVFAGLQRRKKYKR